MTTTPKRNAGRIFLSLGLVAGAALSACGGDGGSAGGGTSSDAATAPTASTRTIPGKNVAAFSHPTRIDNPYAPLTKYRRCESAGTENGTTSRDIRLRLDRTKMFTIDGKQVEAAVFNDRAYEDGKLVESTIDYFAQDDEGVVYYVGEDVTTYENGKVKHEGSWRFGRDTDTLGVLMPADPRVGDRWHFEYVPGITIESNTLLKRYPSLTVGGKSYRDVLRVREYLVMEKQTEGKLFARGVGIVSEIDPEGTIELVRCS
jgi:hypothetical protein